MTVTIYHNPRCSKSRETLELIEARGFEPRIVKYLETPPDAATLESLLAKLGLGARDLLRTNESAYKELGLADASLSDAELVKAMAAHPELIQRPIVVANGKARLGRPPESVLEILD
ncbi:MAG TPA: arsenate reductase (glutaredoxin) [Gammaproteobacteria bacterium]